MTGQKEADPLAGFSPEGQRPAACAVRTGNAAAASGIPTRRAALPVQLNL